MKDFDKLYEEAEMVAVQAHVGQTYDIYPYHKHLRDVVNVLKKYGFAGRFILAGWLHDIIEDCGFTYSKISKAFGEDVAEIVLAVTDPCDVRSRKEKKARVYPKIQANPDALIVKLADRIANIENCIRFDNKDKLKMYKKEHAEFQSKLKNPDHAEAMWEHLESLMK